jgi:carboxylesterase
MKLKRTLLTTTLVLVALVALAAALAGAFALRPPAAALARSAPLPAQTYEESVQRLSARDASEKDLLAICRSRLMSHGSRAARVVVFVHGYTSCPEQFAQLAQLIFDAGANVLIMPLPLHGLPDPMTSEHALLRPEQLVAYADEVADIAQGLGDHVTVAGLSAGGLVTGWIAQHRADVDAAVLISPVFGYAVVPPRFTQAAANVIAALPNQFEWWDTTLKEKVGPDYAYPRYSKHALARMLQLAGSVMTSARSQPPAAARIVVVTNAGDFQVSNVRVAELVAHWRRTVGERVETFEFPLELGVGHDLIDPTRPDQKTDVVYAKLRELILK